MEARIHITGELLVETEQGIVRGVDLPGRQGRLVLARLATSPHPVPREELADLVWGGQLPRSWERDLSTIVSKVRSTLATIGLGESIASALGCYQLTLDGDASIDVTDAYAAVEQAESALRADDVATAHPAAEVAANLTRRPFLPGEEGEWVDARRADQRRLLVRSLDALVEVLVRRSMLPEALQRAAEVVDLEPFRESGYAALMRVQLAAGDRADALRTYERARTLLADELGIPPSQVLEDAYRQALDADAVPATSAPARPARGLPSGTVTLLFTDLVGSTDLAERVGPERFEAIRRAHFRILRDAAATRRGHEVKNLGDGLMLAFGAAGDAVACAVDIQQSIERDNRRADQPVSARIGIHVGEPVIEDGDYFGLPVATASRLCAAATGDEILVSDVVKVLAASDGAAFGSARELALKGVAEPVTAWTVSWSAAEERALELPTAARVASEASSFAFVGRDGEVAQLTALVGGAHVALVTGEPGAGKTRVVAELAAHAHASGANVLWGRCEHSGVGAHRAFVDCFRPLVVGAPDADIRRWVGAHAPDLARLVPGLSERLGGVGAALETGAEEDRARLFDGVTHLLTALAADRPTVLVIDDAHWVDEASGLLLRHVATAAIPQLLVVIAYRPTEVDRMHALADFVGDLRRDEHTVRVVLRPLDEADIATLIGIGDGTLHPERAALARELAQLTDGNPFFVREVLRHLTETGRLDLAADTWRFEHGLRGLGIPEGVREVVGRRLSRFDDDVNAVLRTAAVIGREFELDILAEAVDRPTDDLINLLEPALAAQLVLDVAGAVDRFTFSHALVQETLAAEIPASRRVRLHARVARAIESRRATRLDAYIEDLAHHFVEAAPTGLAEEASRYSARAAEAALQQLAYESADAHLRRALEHADEAGTDDRTRCELLILHATVLRALGDPTQRDVAFAAAALARALDDVELLGRCALAAVDDWVLVGLGTPEPDSDTLRLLEETADRLGLTPLGLKLRALSMSMRAVQDWDEERMDQISRDARSLGDPSTLLAATFVVMPPREVDAARATLDELRAIARQLDDPPGLFSVELADVLMNMWIGDTSRVEAAIDDFADLAERLRLRTYQWQPRMWKAALHLLQGRFDMAEAVLATVAEGTDGRLARYVQNQAGIMYFNLRRVRGTLEPVLEAVRRVAARNELVAFCASYALALYETGREPEAARYLAELASPLRATSGYFAPADWFCRTLAEHRLGIGDAAKECYAEGSAYAELYPLAGAFSYCYGSAHYGLALRADQLERWDEADEHFRSAHERNERIWARPWVAYADSDHARMLLRRGRPVDRDRATGLARAALGLAEELGMARLADEARATLAWG